MSDYRGGCLPKLACSRNPDTPGCGSACGHREFVETYRHARDAWEQLRESGLVVVNAAGGAHSTVAAYQLSDEEFAELYPPPLFKDWLKARRRQEPRPDE